MQHLPNCLFRMLLKKTDIPSISQCYISLFFGHHIWATNYDIPTYTLNRGCGGKSKWGVGQKETTWHTHTILKKANEEQREQMRKSKWEVGQKETTWHTHVSEAVGLRTRDWGTVTGYCFFKDVWMQFWNILKIKVKKLVFLVSAIAKHVLRCVADLDCVLGGF